MKSGQDAMPLFLLDDLLSVIKTYAVLEVWVKAQQQTPAIMTVKTMKIATIAGVDLKGAKKYSPPSFSMVKFLY